jgi:hypothetical protein
VQKYIEYREGINQSSTKAQPAPSFTLSSKVAPADASFFAKSSAMTFAPKIPSPLSEPVAASVPAPQSANDDGEGDDEEDIDPEVWRRKVGLHVDNRVLIEPYACFAEGQA